VSIRQFGHVPPPFGALWKDIGRLLDKAIERGGNDWADVVEQLDDGRAQLWLTIEDNEPVAAMVTKIDGDTLEVWLAGGAVLSGSIPYLETAIAASLEAGTTNGRITGRKGWQRVLRPFGWRPRGDDLVKEWAA
jgi:hypothetical protein